MPSNFTEFTRKHYSLGSLAGAFSRQHFCNLCFLEGRPPSKCPRLTILGSRSWLLWLLVRWLRSIGVFGGSVRKTISQRSRQRFQARERRNWLECFV